MGVTRCTLREEIPLSRYPHLVDESADTSYVVFNTPLGGIR